MLNIVKIKELPLQLLNRAIASLWKLFIIEEELIIVIIIQMKKIKNVSKNGNIIKSEAGTGKTLVYFLYLLSCIDINNNKSIEVIYITPTRELALQTEEYLKLLNKENINYKVYIGGKANLPGKINKEKLNFKEIPKILVGTLGKLNNILDKKGKLIEIIFLIH